MSTRISLGNLKFLKFNKIQINKQDGNYRTGADSIIMKRKELKV